MNCRFIQVVHPAAHADNGRTATPVAFQVQLQNHVKESKQSCFTGSSFELPLLHSLYCLTVEEGQLIINSSPQPHVLENFT